MNIEKLIQIVGHIIKRQDKPEINYTKLIKLMYLADRQAIDETGYSISGDSYTSMKHGPVLSTLYDLIRNNYKADPAMQAAWNSRFIKDVYSLHPICNQVFQSELSDYEIETLDKIESKYHNDPYGKMIEITHAICPEWVATDSSVPISEADIMKAVGFTEEQIKATLDEHRYFEAEQRLIDSIPETQEAMRG